MAFSEWAATGRNDPMTGFDSERTCYNPTQCGYITLGNSVDTLPYTYYLNYVYDANADKSMNPYAGTVFTAIPINGAKWMTVTNPFDQIIDEATRDAGWYAA